MQYSRFIPRSPSHETADLSLSADAHPSKLSAGWRRIRAFVHWVASFPLRSTWLEVRSLPQRIEYLRRNSLDRVLLFGKMFEAGPTGLLQRNKRTSARIADTRSLKERLPWTTVVDCSLFLEGWSRGYEYGSDALAHAACDSCTQQTQTLPSSAPSCAQDMSAVSGHTSEVSPAAIAGVTRSDECTRTKL
jgi:hypothetical protein